jgi:hydrocephalus-inducing protein
VERINFGAVSYSFQYTEKIRLTNTSTVDFTYSLRIPGDGKLSQKEFEIEPQKDIIKCKKSKEIFVTFIPKSTKVYEMVMVVDIEGVGQDMLSIPITADAQVPKVEIKPADVVNSFSYLATRLRRDILAPCRHTRSLTHQQ